MTIDLVSNFFGYGTESGQRLVKLFRQEIFEEVAKSDLPGLIFTFVWAFNEQSDWDYLSNVCDIFRKNNGEIYYVELEADFSERLERNKTPHRLECKPTKRNLEWSEAELKSSIKKYRLNSLPGEIKEKNYLRIDNTALSPEEVVKVIKNRFNL